MSAGPAFAIVATVREGAHGAVALRLRSEPPFDLPLEGIDGHQVFLGPQHAAFVFWGPDPESALVRAVGKPDVRQRIAGAVDGLEAPRRLEERHEEAASNAVLAPRGRALGVLIRGVDEQPDPGGARARHLTAALGPAVERQRLFVGEGAALYVFELGAAAAEQPALRLSAVRDAAPLAPERPLELLEETFWFERGERLAPRSGRSLVDDDVGGAFSA